MRGFAALQVGLALAVAVLASSLAMAGEGAGEIYVVKRGQTLSTISHDVLGDPQLWPAIYRANRDQIKDPTVLHVGQALSIPEVSPDPAQRERIREEAVAWVAPPPKPDGPDVAAASAEAPQASATE